MPLVELIKVIENYIVENEFYRLNRALFPISHYIFCSQGVDTWKPIYTHRDLLLNHTRTLFGLSEMKEYNKRTLEAFCSMLFQIGSTQCWLIMIEERFKQGTWKVFTQSNWFESISLLNFSLHIKNIGSMDGHEKFLYTHPKKIYRNNKHIKNFKGSTENFLTYAHVIYPK